MYWPPVAPRSPFPTSSTVGKPKATASPWVSGFRLSGRGSFLSPPPPSNDKPPPARSRPFEFPTPCAALRFLPPAISNFQTESPKERICSISDWNFPASAAWFASPAAAFAGPEYRLRDLFVYFINRSAPRWKTRNRSFAPSINHSSP